LFPVEGLFLLSHLIMPTVTTMRSPLLRAADFAPLTLIPAAKECRVCVIVPVRNEAENLPATLSALARQIDPQGEPIDPDSYEVLLLANNCSDHSVSVAHALSQLHPHLRLHVIDKTLPKDQAYIGKVRQLVMNEAYRRMSLIGLKNRIIASTDGDTEVAPDWIAALIKEFDKGVDAVGGRILTRRAHTPGIDEEISLYFLRRLAHSHFAAQIESLLDPQPHDSWPRHFQYCGANMAVTARMYGLVGGMPLVRDEEDVALYRKLQQADAKIRHSPNVRVLTSARRKGRATGGLAELLEELAHISQRQQAVLVESPRLTEARILVRRQLRQIWVALNSRTHYNFKIHRYHHTAEILAKSLGLSKPQLRQEIETAPTFGLLLAAIANAQKQTIDSAVLATTEISLANMHLRQRLQSLRQHSLVPARAFTIGENLSPILEALQQIQAIPLFSLAD
jgi:hypothetical protein